MITLKVWFLAFVLFFIFEITVYIIGEIREKKEKDNENERHRSDEGNDDSAIR